MSKQILTELTALRSDTTTIRDQLDHITSRMRVNGAVGLENILTEEHRQNKEQSQQIAEIKKKVEPMWTYTEKVRTRFELVRQVKKYAAARPWLSHLVEGFIPKAIKRVVLVVFAVLAAFTFGDASVHVVLKLINLMAG